jgi:hypothetical protein
MTKQFSSLFKDISQMSNEELQSHISEIRRRKYIERPAAAKRIERESKPAIDRKAKSVVKLVGGMSEAERAALLLMLEGEGDDSSSEQ